MLGNILINETINSKDYGIYLTDANVYGKPNRDVDVVSVVGRSGDLIIDNNRYENVDMSYPCVILDKFAENYTRFINEISQFAKTYVRVEDSFDPDTYIMARFVGAVEPDKVKQGGKDGSFLLNFNRKPQRYVKEGERDIEVSGGSVIYNDYINDAKPLIRAYGIGTITINDTSVQVTVSDEYTDIDCDIEEAYKGNLNCNNNIVLNNGRFPILQSGSNSVSVTGFTKVIIKPRWWIL